MNSPLTLWFDIFANVDHIHKIKCPVLICHGDSDEVINVRHGQVLHSMLKTPFPPLWLEGAGHNNIETNYFSPFSRKLTEFFNHLTAIPEPEQQQPKL
jgi:pimeloyl-ACP methyl ester carboxylesterase